MSARTRWLSLNLINQENNNNFLGTSIYLSIMNSPVRKVLFQLTERGDFCIHYFTGVLAYAVILRHFIWKSIIWRLSLGKAIIFRMSLIYELHHSLNSIYIKLLFRMYLKEIILLSCCSWAVLNFKFKRSLKTI